MNTVAVVLQQPEQLTLSRLDLTPAGDEDVVVDIDWSGISTGTERLLWTGRMPPFPGMGYPLVPGYESVGRITAAGERSGGRVGDRVFVPGARCFGEVRGLFGGAASRVVVPGARALPIDERLGEQGVLLALAATAYHVAAGATPQPDLIVGHGVLGRLLARLAVVAGAEPDGLGAQPRPGDRRPRLPGGRPGRGRAPRLSVHLRRQRRSRPARHADRAPGAGRRGRARRLLQRAPGLRLPAGLHARGPHPHRRPMAARRTWSRSATSSPPAACRSTA